MHALHKLRVVSNRQGARAESAVTGASSRDMPGRIGGWPALAAARCRLDGSCAIGDRRRRRHSCAVAAIPDACIHRRAKRGIKTMPSVTSRHAN